MSDDGSAASSTSSSSAVQLGFSVPQTSDSYPLIAHRSPVWSDWDGGKIGGVPSWLNPRDIPDGGSPSLAALRCRACRERAAAVSVGDTKGDGDKKGDGDDGGGGNKPNPKNEDSSRTAQGTRMRFVCQIYCPADDATSNDASFHRSLYVFVCPDPLCSSSAGPKSVCVLRAQLPRINPFYPPSSSDVDDDGSWDKHLSLSWNVDLCAVCGLKSKGRCPVQKVSFCGREHQTEHLKHVHKKKTKGTEGAGGGRRIGSDVSLPSVYAELELVVEDEPSESSSEGDDDGGKDQESIRKDMEKISMFGGSSAVGGKCEVDEEEEELDENLEQADLNEMTGAKAAATGTDDPVTLEFYDRMNRGRGAVKDQCLRYSRWTKVSSHNGGEKADRKEGEDDGGPLWISSDDRPSERNDDIPPCRYCGSERKFEFQLMPQMLHYLLGTDNAGSEVQRSVVSEDAKRALVAASAIAERASEENEGGSATAVKNELKAKHEEVVRKMKERLMRGGGKNGGLDWGTIAVYTCTKSCGDGCVDDKDEDAGLGAYKEEFAWRQPPLT